MFNQPEELGNRDHLSWHALNGTIPSSQAKWPRAVLGCGCAVNTAPRLLFGWAFILRAGFRAQQVTLELKSLSNCRKKQGQQLWWLFSARAFHLCTEGGEGEKLASGPSCDGSFSVWHKYQVISCKLKVISLKLSAHLKSGASLRPWGRQLFGVTWTRSLPKVTFWQWQVLS